VFGQLVWRGLVRNRSALRDGIRESLVVARGWMPQTRMEAILDRTVGSPAHRDIRPIFRWVGVERFLRYHQRVVSSLPKSHDVA